MSSGPPDEENSASVSSWGLIRDLNSRRQPLDRLVYGGRHGAVELAFVLDGHSHVLADHADKFHRARVLQARIVIERVEGKQFRRDGERRRQAQSDLLERTERKAVSVLEFSTGSVAEAGGAFTVFFGVSESWREQYRELA